MRLSITSHTGDPPLPPVEEVESSGCQSSKGSSFIRNPSGSLARTPSDANDLGHSHGEARSPILSPGAAANRQGSSTSLAESVRSCDTTGLMADRQISPSSGDELQSDMPPETAEAPHCRVTAGVELPKLATDPPLYRRSSMEKRVSASYIDLTVLNSLGKVQNGEGNMLDQIGALLQQHHRGVCAHMDTCTQRQERLLRQLFDNTQRGQHNSEGHQGHQGHSAPAMQAAASGGSSGTSATSPPQLQSQSSTLTSASIMSSGVGAMGPRLQTFVGTKTLSFIQEDEERRAAAATTAHQHGRQLNRGHSRGSAYHESWLASLNWNNCRSCCFQKPSCHTAKLIRKLVATNAFEVFFAVMIMTNSMLIGMEVEYMARAETSDPSMVFRVLNWIYNIVFLVELLMRVVAAGSCREFLFSRQWAWAWLDMAIVSFSLLEMSLDIIVVSYSLDIAGVDNVSNVRIVRVIRMTRLVRTLRIPKIIRIFSALRTMVFSIMMTLKTLLWALVLLLMIMYLFAIVFTQSAVDEMVGASDPSTVDPRIGEFWKNLPTSTVTLYKAITNGVSWHEVVEPWGGAGSPLVLLFLAYVFFTQFAIVNVITGMFCHTAIETAYTDPDLVAQSLISCKNQYMNKLRDLFESIDDDHSGQITITELEKLLKDDEMQAYFQALDLDYNDAWTLFKLLDEDGSNAIDAEEFVMGCMRLKGAARNIDMARLNADTRWMIKRFSKFMRRVESHLGLQPVDYSKSMSSLRNSTTF